jgi:DNA modification methylase
MGTNNGAPKLAFQEWRHFKEGFTPELVARAVEENPTPVSRCLDPFGGSGTTAIACQFLGIEPVTIEVNPYLADLIDAKLATYDPDLVVRDLGRVLRLAGQRGETATLSLPEDAPPTMVEPGVKGRWIFDTAVATRLAALQEAIERLPNQDHQRLFRVLLGGILLDVSNVVVNGKGRRYRRRWQERRRDASCVEQLFSQVVRQAVTDIHRFGARAFLGGTVLRGDARQRLDDVATCDLAVFSPPYPNSFDYTDVYNLELWVLGYLDDRAANRDLRQSTLCSHVQIDRDYPPSPNGSSVLGEVVGALHERADGLWHRRIPNMVGGYFADLVAVLSTMRAALHEKGQVWVVVGDSRYGDVVIPSATILGQLAGTAGYRTVSVEPFRSMRSSAQQGGRHELAESLVVLTPVESS